ncbi:MAG: EF-P lysine aminoacylase GenX [Planctomycetes bacterium]|nr:EF-P lysine aminoacylase GenX [Planctomycetota bacterium]
MGERLVLRTHPRAAEIAVRRARLLAALRARLDADGFVELDVPVLLPHAGSEPHLHPPRVSVAGLSDALWLQTSPELPCKRLLCAGVARSYFLGHVYRGGREELSTHHQPQFAMLEWYRPGESLELLVEDVSTLARAAAEALGVTAPDASRLLSVSEALCLHAGLDAAPLFAGDARTFARAARASGLTGCRDDDDVSTLLSRVLVERVEPRLAASEGWTFLHGYPREQAALARLSDDDPPVALRVEAYLRGFEIANGYVELSDADELRARWRADAAAREGVSVPQDEGLVEALERDGMPPSVGMALGVDRLALALLGGHDLRDVLPLYLELA